MSHMGGKTPISDHRAPPPPPGAQTSFVKSASDIRDFRNICYNEGAVIE